MNERGFSVYAEVVKKRWGRPPIIKIKITDGRNDIEFLNVGSFTVETGKPLNEPLLYQDQAERKIYEDTKIRQAQ